MLPCTPGPTAAVPRWLWAARCAGSRPHTRPFPRSTGGPGARACAPRRTGPRPWCLEGSGSKRRSHPGLLAGPRAAEPRCFKAGGSAGTPKRWDWRRGGKLVTLASSLQRIRLPWIQDQVFWDFVFPLEDFFFFPPSFLLSARTPGLIPGDYLEKASGRLHLAPGKRGGQPAGQAKAGLPGWGLAALEGSGVVQNFAALLAGVETKRTSSSPRELAEVRDGQSRKGRPSLELRRAPLSPPCIFCLGVVRPLPEPGGFQLERVTSVSPLGHIWRD